ncbi:MAG: magnesium transporter CorA family protein [Patescibacteria group bacterium]|jgi:magnesium transporter|nr:magnesium transporter CorA family protein [Patescibacteria group bacterium]
MAIKTLKLNELSWHYLTDFSQEELNFLKKNFKFHPLDIKDCAGETQRSKIDVYHNYFFLVLQLPYLNKNQKKVDVSQIYFFVSKDYVITISRDRIKDLNTLYYKIVNNQKMREEYFSQGSGYLLYKILDSVLRGSWVVHNYLEQEVRRVEFDIDEGRNKKSVFDIAFLRRIILQLKAIIDPQRILTNNLSRINIKFLNKEMLLYFDDLDDFIEKNLFILDGYKDRVLSLQEINESLISFRTNSVMKILTIFSVALLPLTLLSGIYGMNIDLPFAHDPTIIWTLFLLLLGVIGGILIYLKKSDWI